MDAKGTDTGGSKVEGTSYGALCGSMEFSSLTREDVSGCAGTAPAVTRGIRGASLTILSFIHM